MTAERFRTITDLYRSRRVAVVGDFCLDRYLEIDPAHAEVSLETGLPVHNVTRVRSQAGAAGTIVNNLAALGIGAIFPVGFAGQDGEGFELYGALKALPGVKMDHFVRTEQRRTFTYCKPLVLAPGAAPVELSRLDLKNWTETPSLLQSQLLQGLASAIVEGRVLGIIVMDQVGIPETGVITKKVLSVLQNMVESDPERLVIADSRQGFRAHLPVVMKMNAAELAARSGAEGELNLDQIREVALGLAARNGRTVFVTLDKQGILAATADGKTCHAPALPLRGPIDIVGAGDAVTANLAAALLAEVPLAETLELANAAASVVIHKLGTTGTASLAEIEALAVDR